MPGKAKQHPKRQRVKPNPGTEHLFDPATGKMIPPMCRADTYIEIDGVLHRFECAIPEDTHPNQAHLARLVSTEAFVEAFMGWWDDVPEDQTPRRNEESPA